MIKTITSKYPKVIIAWGNHPVGLSKEYEILKGRVMKILSKIRTKIYYVDRLSNGAIQNMGGFVVIQMS